MDKAMLKQEAEKWREWFHKGQKGWSVAHYTATYGAILCSIAAGGLLQLSPTSVGWAALLTSCAAALSSIAAAGGFQRKWRSNRLSRSQVDGLLLDIEADDANIPDLARQLKELIAEHDREVVKDESKNPSPTRKTNGAH
ncbi:hypothetical protein [Hydrogenophaga soli]